jgi:hypothetical protein
MSLFKKRYIFSLVILFYFLIYAISPLSYTFTAGKALGSFSDAGKTHFISKNIGIFLWELICENLVSKKNIPHTGSTDRIFFKKARAILPEDFNAKIIHLEDISIAGSLPFLSVASPSGLPVLSDAAFPLQEYDHLYSGHSPPSV